MSAISVEHRSVRNQASIDLADTGPNPSSIKLYSAAGGTLLAVQRLAKPCGVITQAGRIQLLPAADSGLVLVTGQPTWGEWCTGAGVPIWGAEVTGESGDGPIKLAGTGTMMVYAGGVVTLRSPTLLG